MGKLVDVIANIIGAIIVVVVVAGFCIMVLQLTIPFIVWVVVMELRKLQVIP